MDQDFCHQLEHDLRSLDLPLLVAELECIRDTVNPVQKHLSDVVGDWLPTIIHQGLDAIPDTVLQELLDNPRCLLELQTEIVSSGNNYWNRTMVAERPSPTSRRYLSRSVALAAGVLCAGVALVLLVVYPNRPLGTWWEMGTAADVLTLPRDELYESLAAGVTRYRDSYVKTASTEQRLIDALARFKDDCDEITHRKPSGVPKEEFDQLRVLCIAWSDRCVNVANQLAQSPDNLATKKATVMDFLSEIARDFRQLSGSQQESA